MSTVRAALTLSLVVAGCATDIELSSTDQLGAKDKTKKCKPHKKHSDCGTATATVDVGGGTITTDNGLTLEIPFGALDSATEITVTTTDSAPPADVPALSAVYEFLPEGLVFAQPVTVTLPLPDGVDAATVYWSRLGEPGFDAIGGTVDLANRVIRAETAHFSQAIVGTLSTTRTITGVGQTTWISASTRNSEPIDFSAQVVEALVPDGMGGFTVYPGTGGTGAALGTFTIPNVPTGEYMLHAGDVYLVTSSNTPDLGIKNGGRPESQRTPLLDSSVLNLSITGLKPWQAGDSLEFFATEADAWDFGSERFGAINPGDTSTLLPFDVAFIDASVPYLIEGSRGDRATIAQLSNATSANGVPYVAMSRVGQLPVFDLPPTGTTDLSVAMQDLSQSNTIAFDYRGSEFVDAIAQDGHPGHLYQCDLCGGFAGVLGQPGAAEDGFYGANADLLLMFDTSAAGADLVSGTMTYGSPAALGGNWGLLFDARWAAHRIIQLPDSSGSGQGARLVDAIEWVTTLDKAQLGPITPPITAPTNITIDGGSFFADSPTYSLTPTLAWSPPRIGTPTFYTVTVRELFVLQSNNRTRGRRVALINTPNTSFTLPPGILQPGKAYAFVVAAVTSTSADAAVRLATAPFKSGLDIATATVSSGVLGDVRGVKLATVVPIQENQSFPLGLVTTATAVYWAEHGDSPWDADPNVSSASGQIWAADLDGSNPRVLVTGQERPSGITANATHVYWTNALGEFGSVMQLDLATNQVTTLVTNEPWLGTGILVLNGDLFWTSGFGLRVLRAGNPSPVTLDTSGGVNLASDGVNVYWTQYAAGAGDSGRVLSMPVGGGPVTVLADNQPQAWDVQTDGTYVYWSNQAWQQPFPATINRVPVGGGAAETIASGDQIMKVFAIDSSNAYYVNNWELYAVPLDGSAAPARIAFLPGGCPEGKLTVTNGDLFYSEVCTQGVYRVELP